MVVPLMKILIVVVANVYILLFSLLDDTSTIDLC
jgi:hypothetical protein